MNHLSEAPALKVTPSEPTSDGLTRREYLATQAVTTVAGVTDPKQLGKVLLQTANTQQWQSPANRMAIRHGLQDYYAALKAWQSPLVLGVNDAAWQYKDSNSEASPPPLIWQLKKLWHDSNWQRYSQDFRAALQGPAGAFFEFLGALTRQYSTTAIPEATAVVTSGYLQASREIKGNLNFTEQKLSAALQKAQNFRGNQQIDALHKIARSFTYDNFTKSLRLPFDERIDQVADREMINTLRNEDAISLHFDHVDLKEMLQAQLAESRSQYQDNPVLLQALQLAGFSDDEVGSSKQFFWLANNEIGFFNSPHPLHSQTWLCSTDLLTDPGPLPWQVFLKHAESKFASYLNLLIKTGKLTGAKAVLAQQELSTLQSYRCQLLDQSDLPTTLAIEPIEQASAAQRWRMELLVSLGLGERTKRT